MDAYHPIASYPSHLDHQQFQYSNFLCDFDPGHSKISSNSWIDSDGRSSLSNSSSISCWEDINSAESCGTTNNQFDVSQYWDNYCYNSLLNDGCQGVNRNQYLFARPPGIQNYSRHVAWKSWKEKQEALEISNFNCLPSAMTLGKSDVRFRNSSNFKESAICSGVSDSMPDGYRPLNLVNQCSYSSQSESTLNTPLMIQDISNQSNSDSSKLNFGKKKRKREINKVQRQAANMRERKRMNRLNKAFEQLWQKMPKQAFGQFSKNLSSQIKFSRVFILRSALCYIEYLKGLLDGDIEIMPELPSTLKESD